MSAGRSWALYPPEQVTHEHSSDLFRPQVKIVMDAGGHEPEKSWLINTRETDSRGEFRHAAVEAGDPGRFGIDPLAHL